MGLDKGLAKAVRDLDEYELRRLVIYAQDLLDSAGGPRFDPATSVRPKPRVRIQHVKCGKPSCRSCPHGPYWYAYWREGGKVKTKYLGKELPEGLLG